ncbi:phosphoenolpyruvate synthase [Reinekea blandensis]|uniref:Phosphoenolpyruvate synthase n=1 Tax=Reinekea blandensis MED297 TaxID=314283 RepID=A4BDE0_9GAMM|nr:phosphoenolpyruvate synthase [Reinekea blandensis]EAR09884.1 phosphoenolpyruvate synthase [Reinekea sp. MED297] [Reinekea blandensis MED297]
MNTPFTYVKRFAELRLTDVPLVGGKNASLAEMYRELHDAGVRVPNGFATTADAYWALLDSNGLRDRIAALLSDLDKRDVEALKRTGDTIRGWIRNADFPDRLESELLSAYHDLCKEGGSDVAVRSSATAEDLPNASFAGQQETYLNVQGDEALLETCKACFASLFTNRAISYREDQGFDHMKVALSIGVQRMVRSDKGASGVMFTLDTETGFDNTILVTAAFGLGENVVQGAVNPDEFQLFKPSLRKGKHAIIHKHLGEKAIKMVYAERKPHRSPVKNINVGRADRETFALTDDEAEQLGRYALAIEDHYSRLAGMHRPMDIEWAKDGLTGELFIVQARPETVHSQREHAVIETYRMKGSGDIRITGKSVGSKIASGRARVIMDASHMNELKPGEVLVTDITDPDWEPIMKLASAIVTNRGGRTCHAAIIARELGIPAIVGTSHATEVLVDDEPLTISCAEGDTGYVYAGELPFEVQRHEISLDNDLRTKIMVILGNPQKAFEVQFLPNDGIGLARLEFIINSTIGIHPNALLNVNDMDEATAAIIDKRTAGYDTPAEFYVEKLTEGIGTLAAAFYPKPVIVRLSDFKSNEYAQLIGGDRFEEKEENPMIGFRGASRYIDDRFRKAFALECQALRRVRNDLGLDNVAIMVPFVRSVDELKAVQKELKAQGLERGKDGLLLYVMCEIPTNALLADQFLDHCDGFSIGSNDLTQLTLGVDRDSQLVTGHDERDDAVKALMKLAIDACKRRGKYIGICGQAPSDWPEITRWLVSEGIESISLNADSLLPMRTLVTEEEKRLTE